MITNIQAGPTTPYASVEHENFKYVGYTGVFNILDYPAVSFPSGVTAHKEIDKASSVEPLSELCTTVQGLCESLSRSSFPIFYTDYAT